MERGDQDVGARSLEMTAGTRGPCSCWPLPQASRRDSCTLEVPGPLLLFLQNTNSLDTRREKDVNEGCHSPFRGGSAHSRVSSWPAALLLGYPRLGALWSDPEIQVHLLHQGAPRSRGKWVGKVRSRARPRPRTEDDHQRSTSAPEQVPE